MDEVMRPGVPDALRNFVSEGCGVRADQLRMLPGAQLPEPARHLLVHPRDMTSTLAAFHGSTLRVDILEQSDIDTLYLREVFLRTTSTDAIVEYGVIAIALPQFTRDQQADIRAGEAPLGALLHRFQLPFESSPIGFFSMPAENVADVHRATFPRGATCFGRFNRLSRPNGEPLAWIMEILPPSTAAAAAPDLS